MTSIQSTADNITNTVTLLALDVFATVADWHGGIVREVQARRPAVDGDAFVHRSEPERRQANRVMHCLAAWPDSAKGLKRLKTRATITTLSNGNIGLPINMAK